MVCARSKDGETASREYMKFTSERSKGVGFPRHNVGGFRTADGTIRELRRVGHRALPVLYQQPFKKKTGNPGGG
jgi:hypothetical protein